LLFDTDMASRQRDAISPEFDDIFESKASRDKRISSINASTRAPSADTDATSSPIIIMGSALRFKRSLLGTTTRGGTTYPSVVVVSSWLSSFFRLIT